MYTAINTVSCTALHGKNDLRQFRYSASIVRILIFIYLFSHPVVVVVILDSRVLVVLRPCDYNYCVMSRVLRCYNCAFSCSHTVLALYSDMLLPVGVGSPGHESTPLHTLSPGHTLTSPRQPTPHNTVSHVVRYWPWDTTTSRRAKTHPKG